MTRHLLFAWELGGGLGHAARLQPLCAELQRRGHTGTLVLRDLVQTEPLLRHLPFERLQAPLWTFRTVGVPDPPVSLAEILLSHGYLNAQHVRAQVQGWLSAIRLSGAQALVCDYAPTAVLAAHIAGLPAATLGLGFYMPPDAQPMPAFRDWEAVAAGRVAAAEAHVLANVNSVLAAAGRPPLPRLSKLFTGDLPLLCSWPELDHYGRTELPPGQRWWGPNFLADTGTAPTWPAGDGPKVFAYLKSAHPDHAELLKVLVRAGCRTLCYLPEVAGGKPPPLRDAAIVYASGPVALRQAVAGCALVVCHAGEATLVQALLAGVPVLLLPLQPEQFLIARCVGRTGAGINAAEQRRPTNYQALVRELITQPAAGQQARAFAARHAGFSTEAQTQALCDAIETLFSRPGP